MIRILTLFLWALGTETFMHTLLNRLQTTIALFTTLSSLSSLRIDPILRARIGDGLVPNSRTGSLVCMIFQFYV